MREFVLTSPNIEGEIKFRYNSKEELVAFEIAAELTQPQREYLLNRFPVMLKGLEQLTAPGSNAKVIEIKRDLSFGAYWEAYAYKIGNKARAEKLWKALKESEKLAVFESIPKYNRYLVWHSNRERLYPETFLSQRRWEGSFPLKSH